MCGIIETCLMSRERVELGRAACFEDEATVLEDEAFFDDDGRASDLFGFFELETLPCLAALDRRAYSAGDMMTSMPTSGTSDIVVAIDGSGSRTWV